MIYAPGIILTSLTGAGLVLRQKRKTAYYEGKKAGLLIEWDQLFLNVQRFNKLTWQI
jgi:hypothetical protein